MRRGGDCVGIWFVGLCWSGFPGREGKREACPCSSSLRKQEALCNSEAGHPGAVFLGCGVMARVPPTRRAFRSSAEARVTFLCWHKDPGWRPSSPPHSRVTATRRCGEGLKRVSRRFDLLRVTLPARSSWLCWPLRLACLLRKGGNAPALSPLGEGAASGRGFKSSTPWCFAVKRLCRGGGVPHRGPKGRSFLYPTLCRELLRPFSLGYFSFGPAKEK